MKLAAQSFALFIHFLFASSFEADNFANFLFEFAVIFFSHFSGQDISRLHRERLPNRNRVRPRNRRFADKRTIRIAHH